MLNNRCNIFFINACFFQALRLLAKLMVTRAILSKKLLALPATVLFLPLLLPELKRL